MITRITSLIVVYMYSVFINYGFMKGVSDEQIKISHTCTDHIRDERVNDVYSLLPISPLLIAYTYGASWELHTHVCEDVVAKFNDDDQVTSDDM